MSLPIRLSPGLVSIYGGGSIQGINIADASSPIRFGVVNQMFDLYGAISIGQSVMYNKNDIIAPLFYIDTTFNILSEDKIIAIENPYISPP